MTTTNVKGPIFTKAPCHRCGRGRGEEPETGPCLMSKTAVKNLGPITSWELKLRGLASDVTLTGAAVRRKKKR